MAHIYYNSLDKRIISQILGESPLDLEIKEKLTFNANNMRKYQISHILNLLESKQANIRDVYPEDIKNLFVKLKEGINEGLRIKVV